MAQSIEQAEGSRPHDGMADEAQAAEDKRGQQRDDRPAIVATESQHSQEDAGESEPPQPNLPELRAEQDRADNRGIPGIGPAFTHFAGSEEQPAERRYEDDQDRRPGHPSQRVVERARQSCRR